jgi:glucose/arabinose dehydrogenase
VVDESFLQRHRRAAITISALALITVVLTVIAGCQSSQQPAPPSPPPQPSSPPSQTIHNLQPSQTVYKPQVELPFTGLTNPDGVAVDTAGSVYVTDDNNNRVLKLPAGSNSQVELPFRGLTNPRGVAVDTAGNVGVTDFYNNRVLKLPAG